MVYAFDIDGTICSDTDGEYEKARPFKDRIADVNSLYEEGNIIVLFTGRGTTTGIDWDYLTRNQLALWGVRYHKLIFGKPYADLYIDNRGVNADVFFKR
uniref:Phosphatase n=1 Tax=viral metagenome TaxID=1070528 RepID=A0A6M3IZM3_9ZZZZ